MGGGSKNHYTRVLLTQLTWILHTAEYAKKVPVFHHIGGISQSKKKKNFSRIISSCQFLPKKPIYKELSKISQVQELGLSVSILYRHKASLIPWAHTILTGHKSFWAWKWYSFIPSSLALLQDHFYQVILSEILF